MRLPSSPGVEGFAREAGLTEPARQRIAGHLRAERNHWAGAAVDVALGVIADMLSYAAVVGGVLVWLIVMPRWPMLGVGLHVAAAVVFVLYVAVDRWADRGSRAAVIEAFIREDRCPSCGYEIKTVPVEADGCVVCPECGAAWRPAALGGQAADPEARSWAGTEQSGGGGGDGVAG